MPTPAENAATIVTQAAILDGLVADFRAAKALIDAAEREIVQSRPHRTPQSGEQRLALYAHDRMVAPSIANSPTVEALATATWADLLGA